MAEGMVSHDDRVRQATADLVYIKYNKPVGVVCTTDEAIAGNIISTINHRQRVSP
jgi:23S rRNA pseudouridine2604 synthase